MANGAAQNSPHVEGMAHKSHKFFTLQAQVRQQQQEMADLQAAVMAEAISGLKKICATAQTLVEHLQIDQVVPVAPVARAISVIAAADQIKPEKPPAKERTKKPATPATPEKPSRRAPKKAADSKAKVKAPVPVKFSSGAPGEVWSGRGREPLWLRARIEAGASRDDFLVGEKKGTEPGTTPGK